MRFWRRNVPAEPTPDTEPPVPGEAEAGHPSRSWPDVEASEPPAPEPGSAAPPRPEPSKPQAWLWRRDVPPEPAPETKAPDTDQVPAPGQPQSDSDVAETAALTEPPEPANVSSTGSAERRPWFWQWDIPPEQHPEPGIEPTSSPTPPPDSVSPEAPTAGADRRGWFARLRAGLSRSSARLNEGINTIFLRRRLDDEALEELEELLISSDMGIGLAGEVTEALRRSRFNQEVSPEEVRMALAEQVVRLVEPVTRPLRIDRSRKPFVVLVIGVNGSGKTTTIAKLAKQYRDEGLRVVLAAGDTFRAAAVEQLQIWGERTGCAVVTRPAGSDAAGLAYDALVQAQGDGADILLIDTAGRLHNKADLMGELQKIVRVLKKVDADAPHSVLLVLDATTGQNAHAQAEIFREMVGVTGIVMTKLDGTARGGVLVSLAEKYGIPIHAIGVGETADDLRPFEADAYARSLVGLESLRH
jgi:fused signal recognition particle receptor